MPAPGLPMLPRSSSRFDHHLDVLHAATMLRQPHAVDADDARGAGIGPRRSARAPRAAIPDRALDLAPIAGAHVAREFLESGGVLGDEFRVEHAGGPVPSRRIVHLEQRLAHPGNGGEIAAHLHLVVLRC